MADDVRLQDVARACGTHVTRVSEALSAIGAGPGSRGRAGATITVADAIRASCVRKLTDLGLAVGAAADIVSQISTADLTAMVATDCPTWLAVTPDPQNPDGYVFAILGQEDVREIAAGPSSNVRILNLHSIAASIFAAVLARKQAATKEAGTVTSYTTDRAISGVVVQGLSIAVIERGRGKRMKLSVEEARAIAEQLLAVAAEADPAGGLN